MRLDPYIRDYRGFMKEFVEAIEAEGTLFYLDTSLLMWLLRISPKARSEFIRWCEARTVEAVRVPVWAAHELHRHLIANTVKSSIQKTLGEAEKKCDDFARLASERADETICLKKGYAGRAVYVGMVEQSLARLRDLRRVIEIDETQISQAAEEVINFVNDRVIASDVRAFIQELSLTADFRSSHQMPPGFHDDKKEVNRYGDMIIWEEIIGDLIAIGPNSGGQPRNVILVSRDDKTDWVSSAPFVRDPKGLPQRSNRDQDFDVTLPHPLLVHEFSNKAHGNRIYVTLPGFLASTLEFVARQHGQRHEIAQWLAASHRPLLTGSFASMELLEATKSADTSLLSPPVPSHEIMFETEDAVSVMSASVVEEVQQYKDAVPLEQPILVSSWISQLRQGQLPPFKFGRVLAELSISQSPGWSEQLPAVVEELANTTSRESLNALALALVTSGYFDRHGQILRRPHANICQLALSLETDSRFKRAFDALYSLLTKADARLPYIPGSERKPVAFALNLVQGNTASRIIDVRVGGQSVLAQPLSPGNPRRLSALIMRNPDEGCTGGELRALIAREYLIPSDLLESKRDRGKLTWAADAGLVTLDTDSEGGLSVLAEEENEHD